MRAANVVVTDGRPAEGSETGEPWHHGRNNLESIREDGNEIQECMRGIGSTDPIRMRKEAIREMSMAG